MKKLCILFALLPILLAAVLIGVQRPAAEQTAYLRLHVRANSDAAEDQSVKYAVKEAVVAYLAPLAAECGSKEEALRLLRGELGSIEAAAEAALQENGFSYGARASLRQEEFPARVYEGVTLEAGVYDALIVELGAGEGANWWCVVYPPLCFSGAAAENVALPLEYYTSLSPREIRDIAAFKLALVGLAGFEDFYPSEISGGMKKRAGLARALALDPDVVYFDEPSAGLDPVSAARLDELILQLRDTLGMTVVVVTHELASIFTIANNSVFLDAKAKTMIAGGDPHELLKSGPDDVVEFLTRGKGRDRRACEAFVRRGARKTDLHLIDSACPHAFPSFPLITVHSSRMPASDTSFSRRGGRFATQTSPPHSLIIR